MNQYLDKEDIFPQFQPEQPQGIQITSTERKQKELQEVITALMMQGLIPPEIAAGVQVDANASEEYQMQGEGLDQSHIDLILNELLKREMRNGR